MLVKNRRSFSYDGWFFSLVYTVTFFSLVYTVIREIEKMSEKMGFIAEASTM